MLQGLQQVFFLPRSLYGPADDLADKLLGNKDDSRVVGHDQVSRGNLDPGADDWAVDLKGFETEFPRYRRDPRDQTG